MRLSCLLTVLFAIAAIARPVSAETFVYVSVAGENRIAIYEADASTGQLTAEGSVAADGGPGSLATDPDRRFLFASLRSTSQLASYRIGPSGELDPISAISAGDNAAYVSTDPSGRFLFSAYYRGGKIAVHSITSDGKIKETPLQVTPTAEKAHAIIVDPSGRFVFVPHTGPNAIFQFLLNRKSGRLVPNAEPKVTTPPKSGPRHIWFHPSLPVAYTSDEQGNSVTAYKVDKQKGQLVALQTLSTLPADFDERNSTSDIEVTPSGKYVFVANRGHDSLAGFALDGKNGQLMALGQTPTEQTPRSFNISPDGKFLYAAGQNSGKLAAYRLDDDTGQLTRFATYEVGPKPSWVLVVTR